ncbi:hypothetical protein [Corallococcus exercitus]|uniref:hypothetical protein n=1 Tax=Corallococcus exercitus TaxID=2316736 RepID=UPI001C127105|nr:hypothetical protein [Corallococcus exercitus]
MVLGLMGGLCCAASSFAQTPEAPTSGAGASEQDLAKATQNPVADLTSVPFQDNLDLGLGPFDRARNTLNIQPVLPVKLTPSWSLINRAILPLTWQPDVTADSGGTFGLRRGRGQGHETGQATHQRVRERVLERRAPGRGRGLAAPRADRLPVPRRQAEGTRASAMTASRSGPSSRAFHAAL